MSKSKKFWFIVSLAIFLPIAAYLTLLSFASKMWQHDLLAVIGVAVFFVLGASCYLLGRRLRGRYQLTEQHVGRYLFTGIYTVIADIVIVILLAFTIGYQPWFNYVVGPIFLIGIGLMIVAAFCRGALPSKGLKIS